VRADAAAAGDPQPDGWVLARLQSSRTATPKPSSCG
jgi:hypothetical protein